MDLKELIRYCITNFSAEEATERISQYIQEALILKEKEIELKTMLNKE